jgi:Raf kinase inhibitor-like YbhB/YbcL family protein
MRASYLSIAALLLTVSCTSSPSGSGAAEKLAQSKIATTIAVTSSAFTEGAPVPRRFTCDGEDTSPPISWSGVSRRAAELALVVDDPDAPHGTYVHWVIFGLDPSRSAIEEGQVPAGARQARNSAGDAKYKGPCPPRPDEPHRYRFTLYAVSEPINSTADAGSSGVLAEIRQAATAKGTLIGTFDH